MGLFGPVRYHSSLPMHASSLRGIHLIMLIWRPGFPGRLNRIGRICLLQCLDSKIDDCSREIQCHYLLQW